MQPQKSTNPDEALALTPAQGLPMTEHVATRGSIARSTALIGSGTMLSRLLGLVRDMVIAYLFAKPVSDAFFVAFRLPNMLREMFAEGAMNAGFIPVFSQYMTTRTREETQELCAVTLSAVTALLLVISALGVIFAPAIVRLITLEFGPANRDLLLAIRLSRVLFPYILLIGIASLLMAILNSLHRFFSSSYAPMLLNLSMIVSAYFFRHSFREPVFAMALGVLIGGVLQILLQIPFILRTGIPLRFSWNLRHPGLRRILTLLTPTFFGQAVREVNVIVDTMLGWYLGVGMVSALYYAYRLIHLPLAVFGLSVATAILPTMSRASSLGEIDNLKRTLSLGLRSVFFIMLPATVGLIVLRTPIIRLLYERGKFGPEATSATAFALLGYSFGLFAYAGARVLAFAFYSMKNTRLPVIVATIAMVLNIGLNLVLMVPLRQGGLALASSISSMINMAVLWTLLKRRIGTFGGRTMAEAVMKICLLSLAMGVIVYVLGLLCGGLTDPARTFGRLVNVIVPVTGGMVFYLGLAFVMRLEEAAQLRKIWTRRVKGT
jgi:putative peptidoglycan lipid II flippase